MSRDMEIEAVGDDNDILAAHQFDTDDDEEASDVDIILDQTVEKDAVEQELENLVFGDIAGFKSRLGNFNAFEESRTDQELVQINDETLDDADLFFTDLGLDQDLAAPTNIETTSDDDRQAQKVAWHDSDDERMMVSLATVPRLRKLRKTEAEDVVSGKEYIKRLRQQFELLHPRPEWAMSGNDKPRKRRRLSTREARSDVDMDGESNSESSGEEDEVSAPPLSALLRNASSLVRNGKPLGGKKRKIRPEVISIHRIKDIPGIQPSSVNSMTFHPRYPLLLSCGPSSTIYLHQIATSPPAATPNPLLISLHLRGAPLATSAFHPTDSRIFMAARRPYFHVWDLETGQVEKVTQVLGHKHDQRHMDRFKISPDGQYLALIGSTRYGGIVNILSATTLQWHCQVRIEDRRGLADFVWWRNSRGLCILGQNGEVTEWSVEKQRVVHRWQDEGAVGSTVLALGGRHERSEAVIGDDRWIATGSSSGIVNVYDRHAWLVEGDLKTNPKPLKMLDHLITPITQLAFSHDGQIMAMASKWKKDALRLVHLPSATVFKNWPTSVTPFGTITAVSFADGGIIGGDIHSLLAVGNEQGKIRMWEIN